MCSPPLSHAGNPVLTLKSRQPLSAFTPDSPPEIQFAWKAASEWHGFVRIKCFDLLSEKDTTDFLPADASVDREGGAKYTPIVPFGIYQLDCSLVKDRDKLEDRGTSVRTTFAFAPARAPSQLPPDWPLGTHVTSKDPPLPGFKWFRYFSSWAEDNPAKGQFDWSRLDAVVASVQAVGGELLITNDTTPSWTAPKRPITRPWVKSSTAYPPDDMNDLRAYLDALLQRYDEKSGTIGAFEVWNEANTPDRWQGTPRQMIEMARVFREAAAASQRRVHRAAPARIAGISVSSGDAQDYVRDLVRAGILPYLDAVSGHWYEEMLSYDRAPPINSLPAHVDLLARPLHDAGLSLPIWNTESGIASAPREDGRIISQDELNRRAMASPSFDSKQPWMLDGAHWRNLSERRVAASFVAGITMLMSLGVERTFVYSMPDQGWILDGAPSLSWVALAEFGQHLYGVNFHQVAPVKAEILGGKASDRVLAYRFGSPNESKVIVAWTYQQDDKIGRPKLWQPWMSPRQVRLHTSAPVVEIRDLYGREKERRQVVDGLILVPVGEEPVYVTELPATGE